MNAASVMTLLERRPPCDMFGPGALPVLVYRVVAGGKPATVTVRGSEISCSCRKYRKRGKCAHAALAAVLMGVAGT